MRCTMVIGRGGSLQGCGGALGLSEIGQRLVSFSWRRVKWGSLFFGVISILGQRELFFLVDLGFFEFEVLRNYDILVNEVIFGICIYQRNLFSNF